MRNFYNQPTSKIFDKMFGKGARQLQADPTLDLTKCKCCQCDEVECKGCIEGHFVTRPPYLGIFDPQDNIDKGILNSGGCCHGRDNGLIFEYERPGDVAYGPECCPFNQSPCCPDDPPEGCDGWDDGGGPGGICGRPEGCDPANPQFPLCSAGEQGVKKCCGVRELGASNVRFYYNYVGKYFKMDYAAAGKNDTVWRGNGRPRLCSYCNPSSLDSGRAGEFPGARETCLDYTPNLWIDDQVSEFSYPCSTSDSPWSGCQCMGEGLLKDTNRTSKRLSYHRKREMERLPYYRWLADVMCYDRGNVVANPYYRYIEGQTIPVISNGTLYEHLLAVVHCEHWYELALCDQNPEHTDGDYLGAGMTDSDGNPININTSVLAPRFWVYACSGVPFFDFELEDALKKGYIDDGQYQEIKQAFQDGKTPSQDIMKSLAKGGYFDTADWRQEALSEIRDLRTRRYTADSYGGLIGEGITLGSCCINELCVDEVSAEYCNLTGGNFFVATQCNPDASGGGAVSTTCTYQFCSDLDFLGPVRKRYWQDSINVPGVSGPGRLDPKKARENTISSPRGVIIEPIINSLEDPTLRRIQLPEYLLKDPWKDKNKDYPKDPGPGAAGEVLIEWEDFKAWRDSQWVYMHARPGGWDYVCSGYQNPENPDPELRIPDLPRRRSNIGSFVGGCLGGILGIPVSEQLISGGCSDINCGFFNEVTQQFQQFPVVGCDSDTPSCFAIACSDAPEQYCTSFPEKGGGLSSCRNIAMAANCNGIRFNYTTYKPVQRTVPVVPCEDENPANCYQDLTFHTCDRIRNAYLYRVNLTKGNYDSFCPFTCRNVQIPKQLERAIPVLSTNKMTWVQACRNRDQGSPVNFCPGYYCFGGYRSVNPETGLPYPTPGTYGGFMPVTYETSCCTRRSTPRVNRPLPSDPTHRASNRAACPLYPGPGYPALYDGQFVGINLDLNPFGCCWKCPISGGGNAECLGVLQEGACIANPANDGIEYKTVFKTETLIGCCGFDSDCGCGDNYLEDCVPPTPPGGGGTPPGGGGPGPG